MSTSARATGNPFIGQDHLLLGLLSEPLALALLLSTLGVDKSVSNGTVERAVAAALAAVAAVAA